jgi:hypothetical protein
VLRDFVRVEREAARHSFREVAALDRQLAHLLARVGRADLDLDALRGGFTDEDAVVAAHVVHDGFVEAVATDARAGRVHDAVQREHGDFGGAAADVEHHRAARLVHGQARADRRRHGLTNYLHAARAGAFGRLLDGAAFDLRRTDRHAHQHARRRFEHAVAVHLADEVLQHLLGVGEVGDHAVLHRSHRVDVAGRSTQHVLGLGADGDDDLATTCLVVLHRDNRRLVEHDALVADVNEGIGRSQIDRQIAREIAAQAFKHVEPSEARKSGGNLTICSTPHKATGMIPRTFPIPFA